MPEKTVVDPTYLETIQVLEWRASRERFFARAATKTASTTASMYRRAASHEERAEALEDAIQALQRVL